MIPRKEKHKQSFYDSSLWTLVVGIIPLIIGALVFYGLHHFYDR